MVWQIKFKDRAKKALSKLDRPTQLEVMRYLENHALKQENPEIVGSPLSGNLAGYWRYRVGKYRVICHIQHEVVTILVLDIGKRDTIYKYQSITWH